MSTWFESVCLYTTCFQVLTKLEKSVRSDGAWVIGSVSLLMRVWELNWMKSSARAASPIHYWAIFFQAIKYFPTFFPLSIICVHGKAYSQKVIIIPMKENIRKMMIYTSKMLGGSENKSCNSFFFSWESTIHMVLVCWYELASKSCCVGGGWPFVSPLPRLK